MRQGDAVRLRGTGAVMEVLAVRRDGQVLCSWWLDAREQGNAW